MTIHITKFSKENCRPCVTYGPILKAVAESRNDVTLVELDADKYKEEAARVGVQSVPYTLFQDDQGRDLGGFFGATTKAKVNAIIDKFMEVTV